MTEINSGDKGVSVGRDVVDSVIATGDNTTINQTFVQKVFNFFKPDTETLDQRNRRILLNHVDNFWVKGVLEKSLHGAAMLELGIKEDPTAVTYPWAIKKEETGETLPAGTSMLEIFEQIGMGRSLLILGAPGSGKTTMLLELARQLIERARQNADEPIPMVFNLSSWTESKTLADWLAQELNNIYYVPRKTAPDWVKGNKLLLLLDGLDEVRQESRTKCVDAINQFRKEHGLTSLAVCSRSQDYEELGAKLAFDGAIEVQPLTQKQVNEFFNRFGKEMAGLKEAFKKDSILCEMAETPLLLSIMIFTYRNKKDKGVLASNDIDGERKQLFENYIGQMFERSRSTKDFPYKKQDVLRWLTWLAQTMNKHHAIPYILEDMQPDWLTKRQKLHYIFTNGLITGNIVGLMVLMVWFSFYLGSYPVFWFRNMITGASAGLIAGLSFSLFLGKSKIQAVDLLMWSWKATKGELSRRLKIGLRTMLIVGGLAGMSATISQSLLFGFDVRTLYSFIFVGIYSGITAGLLNYGLVVRQVEYITSPGQRLLFLWRNFFLTFIFGELSGALFYYIVVLIIWLIVATEPLSDLIAIFSTEYVKNALLFGLFPGLGTALFYGGFSLIQHYSLRYVMNRHNLLPFRLITYLDYCTDLIFLRRVGGGYIFVHRLLMEHFAAMYKEE